MRIRTKKWAKPELEGCGFYVGEPTHMLGTWKNAFKQSNNPLHIELGCGKGIFTAQIAKDNPDINYLAIDVSTNILGVCARNIKNIYKNDPIGNIIITNFNIEKIETVLNKNDSTERIYINFCNPWPKKKHKKRRLTHPTKLEKYKIFLKKGGQIYFKTDDDELFSESLDYFRQNGFHTDRVSYDLRNEHYSDAEPNITTEHEEMFSQQGIKIKFLQATLL